MEQVPVEVRFGCGNGGFRWDECDGPAGEQGGRPRRRSGHGLRPPEVRAMSGLMQSVAANLMFVVIFFFAAILLTLGMLGFH